MRFADQRDLSASRRVHGRPLRDSLDVYEHAYWFDYGRLRAKYIEAFFNNLDWNAVNANLERALAMQAVAK